MKRILASLFIVTLVGCMNTHIDHVYTRTEVEAFDAGILRIALRGSDRKEAKRLFLRGTPYNLIVSFFPNSNESICIRSIHLKQSEEFEPIKLMPSKPCGIAYNFGNAENGRQLFEFEKVKLKEGLNVMIEVEVELVGSGLRQVIRTDLTHSSVETKTVPLMDAIKSV